MRGTITVAGSLAQKPGQGGHTWVFLQYLLGFRSLGWDVLFLDRLEPEMCHDATGRPCPPDSSENIRYLRDVLGRFGLGESFAVACDGGREWIGLPRGEARRRVERSAFLLNFMGFFNDADLLDAAPMRVFFDFDPGFGQMWQDLGLADVFRGHDRFVTVGENIGRPDCTIPTCGLTWVTTPQPVVLDTWPGVAPAAGESGALTSIGAWRGPYGPIEYKGRTYGLRAHEFRKFVSLPALTGSSVAGLSEAGPGSMTPATENRRRFEVALDIHPADARDVELLRTNGWSLADPRIVAADPWAYQEYIRRSYAEIMVAKNLYVQSNSGWFSDRSICYLACGRPVVAQDTGFRGRYPVGEGLLAFPTLDEAAAAVETIRRDYERHCRAAREIAEAYFDSDKVLTRLLQKLGVA